MEFVSRPKSSTRLTRDAPMRPWSGPLHRATKEEANKAICDAKNEAEKEAIAEYRDFNLPKLKKGIAVSYEVISRHDAE